MTGLEVNLYLENMYVVTCGPIKKIFYGFEKAEEVYRRFAIMIEDGDFDEENDFTLYNSAALYRAGIGCDGEITYVGEPLEETEAPFLHAIEVVYE